MREGWTKYRLIDVTKKIGSGATPKGGKKGYKESGISLFRSLNVYDGEFKEKNLAFIDEIQASKLSNVVVVEGDVLLNITGASIARCCVAPPELLPARVNQHVSIVRPKTEYIDTGFLAYLLVSKEYKDALLQTGEKAGATRQALTKAQLQDFEILAPPLPEQKRIVAILDEAFAGIATAVANTEKNLANARELFESHLSSVFTQKGVGWEEKTLGTVCENLDSMRVPITKSKRESGDIPYYGASGIVDHVADYLFNEDLLLVSEDGANLLARTYPIAFSISGKTWVNNHAHVLRFSETTSQKFIEYYLNSISLEPYVSGMAQPKLNQKSLNSIAVPFPTIREQKRIVALLDTLAAQTQRLQSHYQHKLTTLAELKQSLLHKAFSGALTSQSVSVLQEAVA